VQKLKLKVSNALHAATYIQNCPRSKLVRSEGRHFGLVFNNLSVHIRATLP